MKISISSLELCSEREQPKNISIERRRQIRTEFPIGSKNAMLFDRENGRYYASFEIERFHNSEDEANLFALEHAESLENILPAPLLFSFEDCSFKMDSASLSKIRTEIDGIKTSSKYEFSAPEIERQNQ